MCFLPRLGALQTGSNVHPSVHDTPAATPAFLPATRTLDPLTTPTHGSIEVRLYEPPSIQPVRPPARPPSPQKKNDVPAIAPNAIYPRHISSHHCTASYTQRIGWAVPLCSEGEAGEPSGGGPEGDDRLEGLVGFCPNLIRASLCRPCARSARLRVGCAAPQPTRGAAICVGWCLAAGLLFC